MVQIKSTTSDSAMVIKAIDRYCLLLIRGSTECGRSYFGYVFKLWSCWWDFGTRVSIMLAFAGWLGRSRALC